MESSNTAPELLPCPTCDRLTDSLKQYRYVNWCVYFFSGAIWQMGVFRACPECMRRHIWRKCFINVIPAHFLWLVGLLPWALTLIVLSKRPGHSRAVVRGITPEMVVAREMAEREVSWKRVLAVVSLLVFWMPLFGLAIGGLAYWLNRRSPTWTCRASQVSLVASGLIHVVLAGLVIVDVVSSR
jgi:hypothetical protein